MRLPKPFYRLPLRFDVERMRAEVASLPDSAWAKHPNAIEGNSSVRLISVGGGENDDVDGAMAPTPHLQQAPYLRQILASFGVVWSRSRLMRLDPHSQVPEHADINHHWFSRVRMHIPVITRPEVQFHCGGQAVHMAAGEAWLFDNWRLHRVENPTDDLRIHFVADTSGSAAFWQYVAQSESPHAAVRELHAKLTNGGTLLVYVPAFPVLYTSMDAKVGHVRRYTRSTLVRAITGAGLKVESVAYVDSLGFFATLLFKYVGGRSGEINRGMLRLYDRVVFPLSRALDLLFGRWFGKNLLLIARKSG